MSKKTNWQTTDNRFIVFLDIMGFKDLVMRKSHDFVYDMLSDISKVRSYIENTNNDLESNDYYSDSEVYSVSFSDSIILFSKTDSVACFDLISFATIFLFGQAFKNNVPLKGAMACGKLSVNKSKQIYFGQPLIDSYLLEEDIQYYGVTAHHTFVEFLEKNRDLVKTEKLFVECNTPLKSGIITHFNLNWYNELLRGDDKDENIESVFKEKIKIFRTKTSGAPSKYIDNTIKVFNEINTAANTRS